MYSILYPIYISGILLSLNSWVDSKDFCVAFIENNLRISYTYRRFYGQMTDKIPVLDIIINGFYWRLEFSDNPNEEKSLTFIDSKQGIKSPFFSGKYFMATCIRTKEEGWANGRAVLFSKTDWNSLSVGDIPEDDYKDVKDLTNYEQKVTISMSGYYDQEFAFDDSVIDPSGCDGPYKWCYKLVIVSKYNELGNKTKNRWYTYRYFVYTNKTHLRLSPELLRSEYNRKYKAINELQTDYELVSIVPQMTKDNNYGFIFIFIDEMKIRWCWSSGTKLDINRCGEESQVLIECSMEAPKEGTSKVLIFVIVCIVIIIIIVISSLIFLIVFNKRARDFGSSMFGPKTKSGKSKSSSKKGSKKSLGSSKQKFDSKKKPKSPDDRKSPVIGTKPLSPKPSAAKPVPKPKPVPKTSPPKTKPK